MRLHPAVTTRRRATHEGSIKKRTTHTIHRKTARAGRKRAARGQAVKKPGVRRRIPQWAVHEPQPRYVRYGAGRPTVGRVAHQEICCSACTVGIQLAEVAARRRISSYGRLNRCDSRNAAFVPDGPSETGVALSEALRTEPPAGSRTAGEPLLSPCLQAELNSSLSTTPSCLVSTASKLQGYTAAACPAPPRGAVSSARMCRSMSSLLSAPSPPPARAYSDSTRSCAYIEGNSKAERVRWSERRHSTGSQLVAHSGGGQGASNRVCAALSSAASAPT